MEGVPQLGRAEITRNNIFVMPNSAEKIQFTFRKKPQETLKIVNPDMDEDLRDYISTFVGITHRQIENTMHAEFSFWNFEIFIHSSGNTER
jgi:hypothetical protein